MEGKQTASQCLALLLCAHGACPAMHGGGGHVTRMLKNGPDLSSPADRPLISQPLVPQSLLFVFFTPKHISSQRVCDRTGLCCLSLSFPSSSEAHKGRNHIKRSMAPLPVVVTGTLAHEVMWCDFSSGFPPVGQLSSPISPLLCIDLWAKQKPTPPFTPSGGL